VFAATGRGPFTGEGAAGLMYKVVHEEPDPGSLSGQLREIAGACLAKDPASRPSAGEIARALAPGGAASLAGAGWLPSPVVADIHGLMRELTALPDPVDTIHDGPAPRSGRRTRRVLLAAPAALIVSAAALVAVQMMGNGDDGNDIPEAFLGTWQGDLTTRSNLPGGTLRIAIKQGAVGEIVSSDASVSMLNTSCTGDYRLTSAEDDLLVLKAQAGDDGPQAWPCGNSQETARFTMQKDGNLRFESLSEGAGLPQGVLHRISDQPLPGAAAGGSRPWETGR